MRRGMKRGIEIVLFFALFALWSALSFTAFAGISSPVVALLIIGCSALLWMSIHHSTEADPQEAASCDDILALLNSNKVRTVEDKISALEDATKAFLIEPVPQTQRSSVALRYPMPIISHAILFTGLLVSLYALREKERYLGQAESLEIASVAPVTAQRTSERASLKLEASPAKSLPQALAKPPPATAAAEVSPRATQNRELAASTPKKTQNSTIQRSIVPTPSVRKRSATPQLSEPASGAEKKMALPIDKKPTPPKKSSAFEPFTSF